jgi:hypothetical protein
MTDPGMNFQAKAPKIPPRILCIGMPVRDLTFMTPGVPGRGSKENATGFDEICGGNALNAAIGIVRLLPGVVGAAESPRLAMVGSLNEQWWSWVQLLTAYCLLFTTVGLFVFPFAVEE